MDFWNVYRRIYSYKRELIFFINATELRKIKEVIDDLNKGDRLIVPEFSRLGRSMLEIMEMLSILKDREVN